jgi:hypothetical protein
MSVYEPSHLTSTYQPSIPYLRSCNMDLIMDTSHAPHWQRLLYWTAFWNTLLYLLTRDPSSSPTRHRIALAMGCYSFVYALLDEARKQRYVSFASIMISTIAVGHMVWMYRHRRHASVERVSEI